MELLSTAATANYTLTNGQIAATGTIANCGQDGSRSDPVCHYQDTARKSATVAGFVPDTNDTMSLRRWTTMPCWAKRLPWMPTARVTFALKDG